MASLKNGVHFICYKNYIDLFASSVVSLLVTASGFFESSCDHNEFCLVH